MRYLRRFFPVLLTSLVLGGCSLIHPKQEVRYYALTLPTRSPTPSSPAPITASLVVRPFSAQPPYHRDRMVYRSSPYEFDFYHYHRWVTKPADMLTSLTRRSLQQSGLFTTVYPTPDAQADLRLGGVVRQYERGRSDSLLAGGPEHRGVAVPLAGAGPVLVPVLYRNPTGDETQSRGGGGSHEPEFTGYS